MQRLSLNNYMQLQCLESFSFHGMRCLLLVFLLEELAFSHEEASSLYALFIALLDVGIFCGGYMADHGYGRQHAVRFGFFVLAFGHLLFLCKESYVGLIAALSCLILGTSFFKGNVRASLERALPPQEKVTGLRKAYGWMNLSGFFSAVFLPFVAKHVSTTLAFTLAGSCTFRGLKHLPKKPKPLLALPLIGFMLFFHKALYLPITFGLLALFCYYLLQSTKAKALLQVALFFFLTEALTLRLLFATHTLFAATPFHPTLLTCLNPLTILLVSLFHIKLPLKGSVYLLGAFFVAGTAFLTPYPLLILPMAIVLTGMAEAKWIPELMACVLEKSQQKGTDSGLFSLAVTLGVLLAGYIATLERLLITLFLPSI